MAFFSLLDDRARAKGSRDPLGFELVWTYFGRKVVGNLTTITSSWENFAVGLLGFHWSNQLCLNVPAANKQVALQSHFIRYEQLAAYLRHDYRQGEADIMGITRVAKRLGDEPTSISISARQESQILSDQISYGLWGLYSTAMRSSGLVRGEHRELTDDGRKVIDLIEPSLDREWYQSIISAGESSVTLSKLKSRSEEFYNATSSDKVERVLVKTLLKGDPGHACQQALYDAAIDIDLRDLDTVRFIQAVQQSTQSAELKQTLEDILNIDRLLRMVSTLFDYCRSKDGESLDDVAQAISAQYDFSFLSEYPRLSDCPYAEDLTTLRNLLRARDIPKAIRQLLALNAKIMEGRNGAAWVDVDNQDNLRVRMSAEKAELLTQEKLEVQLEQKLFYNYFLDSFARIARQGQA